MIDRIRVVVTFKKFIWKCPSCEQEDIIDVNFSGGNTKEHNCSNCSLSLNKDENLTEFTNVIHYTEDEFKKLKPDDLSNHKTAKLAKWKQQGEDVMPYREPTKKELEDYKAEKVKEAEDIQKRIDKLGEISG